MRIILAVVVIALAGCRSRHGQPSASQPSAGQSPAENLQAEEIIKCENKPFTDEDLERAAMNIVSDRMTFLNELDQSLTQQDVIAARARGTKFRTWVDGIKSHKIQDAYYKWIESYERDYAEVELKIKARSTPSIDPEARAEAARQREEREQQQRARDLARCLPTPESKQPE